MANKKVIFVAFAIEDECQRNLLKGQTLHPNSDVEYIDMSVKEPYPEEVWKENVRTRIKRSNGVIVLVSKNSSTSTGQKWEIKCAQDENKPILAIWAYHNDRTKINIPTHCWTREKIKNFIDELS